MRTAHTVICTCPLQQLALQTPESTAAALLPPALLPAAVQGGRGLPPQRVLLCPQCGPASRAHHDGRCGIHHPGLLARLPLPAVLVALSPFCIAAAVALPAKQCWQVHLWWQHGHCSWQRLPLARASWCPSYPTHPILTACRRQPARLAARPAGCGRGEPGDQPPLLVAHPCLQRGERQDAAQLHGCAAGLCGWGLADLPMPLDRL